MTPEIRDALEYCPNLPSPPAIALRILELGRDPDVQLKALAQLLARDPALTSRVLRASNSSLYAQRRRSDNLRQALVVIGLNATMTLALSFSLAETLSDVRHSSASIGLVWRRALVSATASRLLGEQLGLREPEKLFLAALLQDIGILALDSALPERYGPVLEQTRNHHDLLKIERETLACDHGEAGAWLMAHWRLPEPLATVAAAVHEPMSPLIPEGLRPFVRCVALAGEIADLFLGEEGQDRIGPIVDRAERLLGIQGETIERILNQVANVLPEVAVLYGTEPFARRKVAGVIDQAREILAVRNLQLIHQVAEQQRKVDEMELTAEHLRENASRDALTGLHNRRRLDEVLEAEFLLATENGWPLTISFIDLDGFKRVNDTHGHLAGDAVLISVAHILETHLRRRDFVMRYGGDEFMALLPGTDLESARQVFERLREAIAAQNYEDAEGAEFRLTVSIGLASHMDGPRRAGSAVELVRAADRALYEAKGAGRNQIGIDTGPDDVSAASAAAQLR